MHIDPYIVLGSAVIGLLVGMTGAGGGALMTPMLILLFGVTPSAAISSDLVAAVVMRPIGAAVHLRAGRSTCASFAGWCSARCRRPSSAPICCTCWATQVGAGPHRDRARRGAADRRRRDGAALRARPPRRPAAAPRSSPTSSPRPLLTVAIGIVGGIIVGMTSVGSGSLMIVLLLFLYPMIGANQLVGTDLTQAVPLTLAAALGALAFGHVEFGVTASLIIGSVPAVLVGSLLSSTVPDRYVRPAIAFVIFASGLKYVGLGTTALGWTLCAVLLAAAVGWLVFARPWSAAQAQAVVTPIQPDAEQPELVTQQRR